MKLSIFSSSGYILHLAINIIIYDYFQEEECAQDLKTTTDTTEPVTTQTTPPLSTEAPDLHPKNTYTFNETDHKSTKCVRLQTEILFHIPYPGKDGTQMVMLDL